MIPRISGGAVRAPFAILPLGAASETRLLLAARGLRAVGDGFVSLLLPVYLLELGYGPFETGVIATAILEDTAQCDGGTVPKCPVIDALSSKSPEA